MKWKTWAAGLGAVVVAALVTGCAPGDSTGKISGDSKLRNAGSVIAGFNHDGMETNNASIDVRLKAELFEPFSGLYPGYAPQNLLALNPNAAGSINVNDKSLKFEYEGDVMIGHLIRSNTPVGAPGFLGDEAQARATAWADTLNPEFRARVDKTYRLVRKVDEIHNEKGQLLDGVFIAMGHGRNKVSPTNSCPTCGSYFLSLTLQTQVDIPAGALDLTLPVPYPGGASPAIPAGSTFQVFLALGECGFYEHVGVAEKGKIKVEYKWLMPPPPPPPLP